MSKEFPARILYAFLSHENDRLITELRRDGRGDNHEVRLLVRNHVGEEVPVTSIRYAEPDLVIFESDVDGVLQLLVVSPACLNVTFKVVRVDGRPKHVGFTATSAP